MQILRQSNVSAVESRLSVTNNTIGLHCVSSKGNVPRCQSRAAGDGIKGLASRGCGGRGGRGGEDDSHRLTVIAGARVRAESERLQNFQTFSCESCEDFCKDHTRAQKKKYIEIIPQIFPQSVLFITTTKNNQDNVFYGLD